MSQPDNQNRDLEAAKAVFKEALTLRNFEIAQLTNRNNFFMLFQGVLLAGILQVNNHLPVVAFMGCVAGLAVSILQSCMAAGAKYWQERWEDGVERAEAVMLRELENDDDRWMSICMFHKDNETIKRRMNVRLLKKSRLSPINRLILLKPSVSRIPIYTGLVLAVVWFVLLVSTISSHGVFSIPSWLVGFPSK